MLCSEIDQKNQYCTEGVRKLLQLPRAQLLQALEAADNSTEQWQKLDRDNFAAYLASNNRTGWFHPAGSGATSLSHPGVPTGVWTMGVPKRLLNLPADDEAALATLIHDNTLDSQYVPRPCP